MNTQELKIVVAHSVSELNKATSAADPTEKNMLSIIEKKAQDTLKYIRRYKKATVTTLALLVSCISFAQQVSAPLGMESYETVYATAENIPEDHSDKYHVISTRKDFLLHDAYFYYADTKSAVEEFMRLAKENGFDVGMTSDQMVKKLQSFCYAYDVMMEFESNGWYFIIDATSENEFTPTMMSRKHASIMVTKNWVPSGN
jgi:hypothetical protein